MRSLKLCRVSPPGKTGSRERKDGAEVSALHNASYPHVIHRLWTTPTEHLFGCMVHLTEHLFGFITQPTKFVYGIHMGYGGYGKTLCMANTKTPSRGCQIPLTRLSNVALRHSQIPITTLVIITHNRNRNVNRYYIRNRNDIRNVALHITSRNVVSHTQSQIVNDYAMITQSLSHITYAITYTIAIVIAQRNRCRNVNRYRNVIIITYASRIGIQSDTSHHMTHHHMTHDPSHHMTQSSIVIVNRQGTMGYLTGNPHTHTHHYIPSTHPLT